MAFDLGTPDTGCLLLADISGYTEYMGSTELMHAQDVVADLLETIIHTVEPIFTVSKLEGDAAFAHADASSLNPSMVMDTVESAYFAFQKRLRDIVHSTSCECNACILIPNLDLKFFIHDGEYVLRRIGRTEELAGPDVILVHRLMKGTAGTAVERSAYAVYTASTLETMAMDPAILGFIPHTESFPDIGDVGVYVQDLASRWAFEQERNRDYITSARAAFEVTIETTAPPSSVWDHLTDPAKRTKWQKHVTGVDAQTEGRQGPGAVNHCMHGEDVTIEHVADWRPFSYITTRYDGQWPTTERRLGFTYDLEQTPSGTRLTTRIESPADAVWDLVGDDLSAITASNTEHLRQMLDEVAPS
jgi:class 3 adenylate cyclase